MDKDPSLATEQIVDPNIDQMTGLPTYNVFKQKLDRLVENFPGQFSLMFIDLDGLKDINDTKGHTAGNKYLARAAGALQDSIRTDESDREPDLLGRIYRYGGDEFVVLLPNAYKPEDLEIVKTRLTTALHEKGVEASMDGVTHEEGQSSEEFLHIADQKQYEIKEARKDKRYKENLRNSPIRKRVSHYIGRSLLQYSGIKLRNTR